ncbi:hypothetical protein ILYODFUR_022605 [Ilyodon furcidens]|uniref:Uncharacterized protein n=1 Tax=Ilyodon furcidens TaxID=33524 RepID=A0ABV0VGM9_9TELE
MKPKVRTAIYQDILEFFMLSSDDKLYGDPDPHYQRTACAHLQQSMDKGWGASWAGCQTFMGQHRDTPDKRPSTHTQYQNRTSACMEKACKLNTERFWPGFEPWIFFL